jgi:V-type H+-transporting ATPase subunit C
LKRSSVKGSPVVPGSLKRIFEEGEFVLYAVTVLRGHYTAGYFEGETFIQGNSTYS